MASLTEVSLHARRAIRFIFLGTVAYLVLQVILVNSVKLYKKINPAPAEPPAESFGDLPQVNFPEQEQLEFQYTLETIAGSTPDLGDRAQVYFMPSFRRSLLGLELANQQATNMNLPFQPEQVDDETYRWTSTSPSIVLTQNIITGSLVYLLDWYQSPQIFTRSYQLPEETQLIKEARQILSRFQLDQTDLESGPSQITYLKRNETNLITALSPSDAEAVRVDLYRTSIDELSLLPPHPQQALVSIIFSNTRDGIIQIDYTHYPIDLEKFSDYSLKTSFQAWQELQQHQGYIASPSSNDQKNVTIRSIELAYFEPSEPTNYLQPIYVFYGDNDFIAYVPAIGSSL